MKEWYNQCKNRARYFLLLVNLILCLLGAAVPAQAQAGHAAGTGAAQTQTAFLWSKRGSQAELTKKKKKKNKNKNNQNGSNQGNNQSGSNQNGGSQNDNGSKENSGSSSVTEDGTYTSKEEVAEYLHLFGHLPDNFITKNEAKDLGWVSSWGNLDEVAPGKSIGGDYFGNYEGQLPTKKGRKYYECDIDFTGGYRSEKRIIYSNDGLVFYTEDHYETFEQLY